ncbi:hypothetical protein N1031_17745 [Herbiconiux moechotypicola]|uniref:Uncharacterized protein n=1 Tax=Herbiconiux moechotypicola TaxID=637393 RepID=A0ABN3E4Y7_9MICO|nr:hypothetical protein [Herbiconiux moechotypicola]MCS5731608.1 hypothetical protein [Herbiconiux moechotypicola]
MSLFGGGRKDDPFEPGKTERENQQKKAEERGDGDPSTKPSTARVVIWVVVGAIGLYLLGSGIWGIITH